MREIRNDAGGSQPLARDGMGPGRIELAEGGAPGSEGGDGQEERRDRNVRISSTYAHVWGAPRSCRYFGFPHSGFPYRRPFEWLDGYDVALSDVA
ncbi:hypothetical protein KM043_004583 [Ampulex compressa]|nr:hypothetical protein KM043_004583 [Ampulex compressa]